MKNVVLLPVLTFTSVMLVVLIAACGGKVFPKCDDSSKPNGGCPPVEPNYPQASKDAGLG